MRILLIRHAEPDYTIDSLTAKGRTEADLLSRRLANYQIRDFYVSPLGRAKETAAYTLNRLHRAAESLPWLQEFRGRCSDPETGKPRLDGRSSLRKWGCPYRLAGNRDRCAGSSGPVWIPERWPGMARRKQSAGYHCLVLPLWYFHGHSGCADGDLTRCALAPHSGAPFLPDRGGHRRAYQRCGLIPDYPAGRYLSPGIRR